MSLNILVIGDPLVELKPGKETTLALIAEAQHRDYTLDYCTATDLCQKNTQVYGYVHSLKVKTDFDDFYDVGTSTIKNLKHYDIILLRSNPQGYRRINTAYMLDPLADQVFISNDPRGIREAHGKFFTANFPDFIVPYTIVEHAAHFEAFLKDHADVIVKPINGFGGKGVQRLTAPIDDIEQTFENLYKAYNHEPFIVQDYIPDAVKGDKRIILFNGEPVCSLLRVPKDPDSLANITQGASLAKTTLTLREQALCEEIGPILRDYGLFFVGLDMLGDYLSEVNLISVGTIVPANQLYDIKLETTFWDKLEAQYNQFKQQPSP